MKKLIYNDVEGFLEYLPEAERTLVEYLRSVVTDAIPGVREKLSYGVPYYSLHTRICFIWPASVNWGGVKEGVLFGFCKGHLLADEAGWLERGNRKEVFCKTFLSPSKVDLPMLKMYLNEAVMIDGLHKNLKKSQNP